MCYPSKVNPLLANHDLTPMLLYPHDTMILPESEGIDVEFYPNYILRFKAKESHSELEKTRWKVVFCYGLSRMKMGANRKVISGLKMPFFKFIGSRNTQHVARL